MMPGKKIFTTITILISLIIAAVAAVKPGKSKHKNLKILPQDISDEKLDSIMKSYTVALGVKCDFCHTQVKSFPDSLDYASDAEPMKEEARKMMRMTIYINQTHFYFDENERPEYLKTVTCKTCHRGEPFPPED
jgi:hypothetical protein